MDNNTSYETQAIDINLLSVLDITKEGKVVSVEKWVELWNLVFQHINKIDAFCVDMQSTLDNWHESEIALNEIIEDMQMKYAALSTGFTHYGEEPPQNPHINFWVRRMDDIAPYRLLTTEDVDSELSSTSTNPVQNKVINTALSNKMDKTNPTGTGSFSLNRKSGTTIGDYSFAEGINTTASGNNSHAEGYATVASGDRSHAEGYNTKASGNNSHAEGNSTTASGSYSHAEGSGTTASGYVSHAEGSSTTASGYVSQAEGSNTTASGSYSHAEGNSTTASGSNSHAEGNRTTASSSNSHAEGYNTTASSNYQHVQGKYNIADTANTYADIIGNGSSDTNRSNAATVDWNGNAWYAGDVYVGSISGTNKDEGSKKLATEEYVNLTISSSIVVDSELSDTSKNPIQNKVANAALNNKMDKNNPTGTGSFSLNRKADTTVGNYSFAEGYNTTASGNNSHAEGYNTKALGNNSHAEGNSTTASGAGSHAEGASSKALGNYSHTEGNATKASGASSHAEGGNTTASGAGSHAEGANSKASGNYSHAEGGYTTASGESSHAEGSGTTASGTRSHAEGSYTTASGESSHTEGNGTAASGSNSHAEGGGTRASSNYQHVQGKYNIADTANIYADIIGNGSSYTNYSNAATVDWKGNAWYAGAVTSKAADYAEFFEWLDGNPNNEDRVGYLVALDGEKIGFANPEDEILGIISANPAILGDNYECDWNGKYLTDEFGRILYDKVEEFIDIPKVDEETGETTVEKKSLGFFDHPRINPDYDPDQEYINRRNRLEWAMVGMLGKLLVRDDGTAQINGYVSAGENGIATASVEKTNIRVLSRINDHIVKVLLK